MKTLSAILLVSFCCSAVAAPPQRIVSLSPNLTEIVFALGLGDKVVGVSSDSDWPAEANSKPKVGTFWQPNIEVIIAAKPDLVVCETFLQQNEAAHRPRAASFACQTPTECTKPIRRISSSGW